MPSIYKRIFSALEERIEQGNFRKLEHFDSFLDFFSNDYLGLARIPFTPTQQLHFGGSSRLIAGTNKCNLSLEQYLADLFQTESALLFNSGYDANIGVLGTLPQKGDVVLFDSLCHASIREGNKLNYAQKIKFKHNDPQHLEQLLKKYQGQPIFVVVESLYSMDGDFAPLDEVEKLCQQYNAQLIIDEAHRAGCFDLKIPSNDSSIRIITFGKAFGAHGACVLSPKMIKDYLINFCKPFIYTTALPDYSIQHIQQNITHQSITNARKELFDNIQYFQEKFSSSFQLSSDALSPIQSIIIHDRNQLKTIEKRLHREKIGVKAIFHPTVPMNQERLRISIHSFNTKKEINLLLDTITP